MTRRSPGSMDSDPKVDRALRHDGFRRLLRREIAEHDASIPLLAHTLGVSPQQMHRTLDGDRDLHAADLELLPPLVRRPIVERLAESLGCSLADVPDADEPLSDVVLLAHVARQSSEAVATLAEAMADGCLDATEAHRIEREATEAIAALQGLRLRARQVQRERVVAVRVLDGGKR